MVMAAASMVQSQKIMMLSVDEFASEVTNCLSVDEFASEVTNCLSVDEFASELTNCLSVDEFASEHLSVDETHCFFPPNIDELISIADFFPPNRGTRPLPTPTADRSYTTYEYEP